MVSDQAQSLRNAQAAGIYQLALVYSFEPVIASALCVLAVPVLLAAGAVTMAFSRRSPFVAHRRVGMGGTSFWMWKLRTMWDDSTPTRRSWRLVERLESADIPEDKASARDPRLRNRFSAFCRKHSIDELPQLFHVASGRMSLVGPRPITRIELDRYYGSRADETLRLRPGLTGLWQVKGRNGLTYEQRCRMDLALAKRFSLRVYFSILLRTIPRLIDGAGSY